MEIQAGPDRGEMISSRPLRAAPRGANFIETESIDRRNGGTIASAVSLSCTCTIRTRIRASLAPPPLSRFPGKLIRVCPPLPPRSFFLLPHRLDLFPFVLTASLFLPRQ